MYLPFAATWMDLEDIMLSEISQTERQTLSDVTYGTGKNTSDSILYLFLLSFYSNAFATIN